MTYPESLLADNEHVVTEMRPHWRALMLPIFWLLVLVAAGGYLLAWMGRWFEPSSPTLAVGRAIVLVVGIFLLIFLFWRPLITWLTTQYVFTNRRIIVRTGLLARRGRDIPLARITNVSFEHSVIERFFHSGRLVIDSANESASLEIVDVPDVERMQREIFRLQDEDEAFRAARGEMYQQQFRTGQTPAPLEGYVEPRPGARITPEGESTRSARPVEGNDGG